MSQLNTFPSLVTFADAVKRLAGEESTITKNEFKKLLESDWFDIEFFDKGVFDLLIPDISLNQHFDRGVLDLVDIKRILVATDTSFFDLGNLIESVRRVSVNGDHFKPELKGVLTDEEDEKGEKSPVEEETRDYEDSQEEVLEESPEEVIEVEATEYRDKKPVYRIDTTESEALVVHCGDPRFQKAFRLFINEELGIANYTPIIIGGGVHSFGLQSFLPKNFKILWEQIKFFVKEGKLSQVIIINHEDCKWYEKMKGYRSSINLPVLGRKDLFIASEKILEDFAGVEVRSFFASLDSDEIIFEEVNK